MVRRYEITRAYKRSPGYLWLEYPLLPWVVCPSPYWLLEYGWGTLILRAEEWKERKAASVLPQGMKDSEMGATSPALKCPKSYSSTMPNCTFESLALVGWKWTRALEAVSVLTKAQPARWDLGLPYCNWWLGRYSPSSSPSPLAAPGIECLRIASIGHCWEEGYNMYDNFLNLPSVLVCLFVCLCWCDKYVMCTN